MLRLLRGEGDLSGEKLSTKVVVRSSSGVDENRGRTRKTVRPKEA